jgi:RNA ligase (TIGR02306 family)
VLDDSGIVQGITRSFVKEGDNVADLFGITKWEPVIPASMAGEVYAAGQHLTVPYDIENFKRFPDVIAENEEVIFTEKLHGTFCGVGILPTHNHDSKHYKGEFVVFSKGLGAKGLCFKDAPANDSNVYVRCLNKLGIFDSLRTLREHMEEDSGLPFDKPLFVLGEIFGGNVQDNGWYGNDLQFRIFDVCAGYRGDQWYFGYEGRLLVANQLKVSTVPTLYEGPFSKELMIKYTSGKETVSGKQLNMREGLVVTPIVERRDSELGRVILKSVSEEYLLRKGGSEFN